MNGLDPRAHLALLLAVVLGVLFGGPPGIGAAAVVAAGALVRVRAVPAAARVTVAVAPLALAVLALDWLAGEPARGALAASRLVTLALVSTAFAHLADGEALVAALRWIRMPYALTFVLVTGTRLVPLAAADLADLRDAAQLRGMELGGSPRSRLAAWRILLVPLLVTTIRRALRLGEAMEARGFAPDLPRTTRLRLFWRARDTLALALAVGYVSLLIVAAG